MSQDLERSTFQRKPAYRYIRQSDRLPSTDKVSSQPDPVARVKLFNPTSNWTWYVCGYDPETRIAYGLVDGYEAEVGDFSMAEVVLFRGPFGLPIERDLSWSPRPISEIMEEVSR